MNVRLASYTKRVHVRAQTERDMLPEVRAVKALRRAAEIWRETATPLTDRSRAEWHAIDSLVVTALDLARQYLRSRDVKAFRDEMERQVAASKTEPTLKEGA